MKYLILVMLLLAGCVNNQTQPQDDNTTKIKVTGTAVTR